MTILPQTKQNSNLERCDQCDAQTNVSSEMLCASCVLLNSNLETYETLGYWIARAVDGLAQNDPGPIDSFRFGVHRAVDEMTQEMTLSRSFRKPVVEVCDARPDLWSDASEHLARAFLRVCSADQLEVLGAQFHRVALEEFDRLNVPNHGGSS